MCVDRHGRLPEGRVQDDIGRFATHAGQLYKLFACFGYCAIMLIDEDLRGGDHVFGLGVVQADSFDVLAQVL